VLGAQALGANNLLLLRGSNLPEDHRLRSTSVFDARTIDLIATAAAIRDGDAARKFRKARPDSIIPSTVVKRLEQAADSEGEGVQIGAELLQEIADIPGLAGVTLVTPGEPESIPAAIHASGLRE